MELKSVKELLPLMDSSFRDISSQVCFKEGYNKAIELSNKEENISISKLLATINGVLVEEDARGKDGEIVTFHLEDLIEI